MTILSDIRTRIRKDLHDTDSLAYRWTDAQLDRHIERALNEFSVAIPQEKLTSLATTNGSREVSVASLTGLIAIEAIEYPVGDYPPTYITHSRWVDTVLLHVDTLPSGGNVKFSYLAKHVLDGSGSTIPAQFEDLVATGAAGYAALELSSFATERININPDVVAAYAANGRAWLAAFTHLLRTNARANRVRGNRLYVPA